jgi:hypothetical protein
LLNHLKSVDTNLTRRAPLRRSSVSATSADSTEAFYLFNDDVDGGYVIVSASDRMRPIVAYSPTGHIDDTAALPQQLRSWLDLLADATRYVDAHPEAAITTAQTAALNDFAPIAPLLGNIAWDQNDPYSLLCPRKYPTGCMATALAQVMRYHRYPEHGLGSNSYTNSATSQTLSVDFSEQTYQWDLMRETYDATATEEERQEVAKLMYHCGVALNMAYAADNSGSTAPYYLAATIDHFGYNDLTTCSIAICTPTTNGTACSTLSWPQGAPSCSPGRPRAAVTPSWSTVIARTGTTTSIGDGPANMTAIMTSAS